MNKKWTELKNKEKKSIFRIKDSQNAKVEILGKVQIKRSVKAIIGEFYTFTFAQNDVYIFHFKNHQN